MAPIDLNLPPLDVESQVSVSLDAPPRPTQSRKRKHTKRGRQQDAASALLCCSAPDPKRPAATAPAQPPLPPTAPCSWPHAPPCCSLFGAPTGRLEDRFRVSGAMLGSGQFGAVRECRDLVTGEALACKTVPLGRAQGQGHSLARVEDLRGEVASMLRVQGHEGVVQLRGVFEDEASVHLVLDLCRGGDLFDEVVRRGRFSEPDAALLFAEAARAVAFCHGRRLLHRDLKPENLLLTRSIRDGTPLADLASQGPLLKLADFGLAVPLAPGQTVEGMAGSPFYMAPEVLSGEYGLKADVWSLGVVLYILLCGSPPFWGESDTVVFEAIRNGIASLTTAPWDQVSGEAKDLVRWLLCSDPARRPPAHKVLSHPWLVRHLSPRGPLQRASTSARPLQVI